MTDDEEPKIYTKPGYDGRLEYFKVLKDYMINIANAQFMGDFAAWLRLLRGMFALVQPYINPVDATKINAMITTIRQQYTTINSDTIHGCNKKVINGFLDNKLQTLMELLYTSSKHLLLPTQPVDDDEYDFDSFAKGSDL